MDTSFTHGVETLLGSLVGAGDGAKETQSLWNVQRKEETAKRLCRQVIILNLLLSLHGNPFLATWTFPLWGPSQACLLLMECNALALLHGHQQGSLGQGALSREQSE